MNGSLEGDGEPPERSQNAIINGTVPTTGALAPWGVVNLFGCTGTLIANQYVLTAHHCVRSYDEDTDTWGANVNSPISVAYETSTGTETAQAANVMEPSTPWSLNAKDYALIELDRPIPANGESDGFFIPIYMGSDVSLLNQNAFCMGYGGTAEATATTFATGFGTLTSATMAVDSVGAGTFYRGRHNNVVGFGGDSGSACFLNGDLIGVQSTCSRTIWYDVDGDGKEDRWPEWAGTTGCTSSSPLSFRGWVNQRILANASVQYQFVPPLSGSPTVEATVSVPNRSDTIVSVASSTWSSLAFAVRSGYFRVAVSSEPPGMMCSQIEATTPLSGNADVQGVCMGDGLVAALL